MAQMSHKQRQVLEKLYVEVRGEKRPLTAEHLGVDKETLEALGEAGLVYVKGTAPWPARGNPDAEYVGWGITPNGYRVHQRLRAEETGA